MTAPGEHRTTTHRIPGLVVTEHRLGVPLDHADPARGTLELFAREVADPDGTDKPFLVFLQGGPGQEAPRPLGAPRSPGWLDRALRDFRVVMLDQRGTGLSSPVGTLPGLSAQEQAEHLALFRADAIVRDAELLRQALGAERWSVLGQSFGGFCTLAYLSQAPQSLHRALFTGGVPPVGVPVDTVYASTYRTQRERNLRHHRRYPEDRGRIEALLERMRAGEVVLPGGDVLSPERFRQVGNVLGMSDGSERLHALLERDPASPAFRHDVAAALPFDGRNPLYAVVHEACYADGGPTRWSAERVLPDDFAADPTLLTGEHVFRVSLAEDSELAPLAGAADLLAERDWPRLYDPAVLSACEVPAAAAVYAEDPYVDRALSEETVALVPSLRAWVTNEYEHDGLRADGARILDRLLAMADGRL